MSVLARADMREADIKPNAGKKAVSSSTESTWSAASIMSISSTARSRSRGRRTTSMRRVLLRWYMPGVFAAVIFVTSSMRGSTLAGAFINADKLLHVCIYGAVAVVVAMAIQRPARPLTWRMALLAAAVAVAYGALDEYHQAHVPGRMPSNVDILADSTGALLGSGWYLLASRKWPRISLILGN